MYKGDPTENGIFCPKMGVFCQKASFLSVLAHFEGVTPYTEM